MDALIAYSSPFVPPEWIVAHGLTPYRLLPAAGDMDAAQGLCPFAKDFAACAGMDGRIRGVIVASTCDQMRRTAERLGGQSAAPVFLMNVPATWQGAAPRGLYRRELVRLGRFLVQLGGTAPQPDVLADAMRQFDTRRRTVQAVRADMTARQYAEAIQALMSGCDGGATSGLSANSLPVEAPAARERGASSVPTSGTSASVRVALVGGPLRLPDFWMYDMLGQLGAEVVLDATETAERGLPAVFVEDRLRADPLDELVRAYFDAIPDAFRRPDTMLHDYLRQQISHRGVRGLILVRYAWCDQWHAQYGRLKETVGIPVVEIDLAGQDDPLQRTRTRIETLVSILR